VTAGDEARIPSRWIPTDSPPDPAAAQLPQEPETQPLTRASIRAAEAKRVAEEAEERRLTSLAEEAAVPRAVRVLAVVTAVALAVLIGVSALVGPNSTALAVGFASVVLAWGWVRLTDAPSPVVAAMVLGAGALAICAAAGFTRTDPYLVWVPVAVAVSVMAAFLHQVFRRGGRARLTEGVASSVGALAVMASGAALIAVPHYPHGGPWVLASILAVAGAALPALFLGSRVSGGWILLASVVLGAGAAVVAAAMIGGVPLVGAALTGLLVAGISHSMMRVLFALPGARAVQSAAAVGAAAVLTVGVVVYLMARIYAG
jgi:hypothetical protein